MGVDIKKLTLLLFSVFFIFSLSHAEDRPGFQDIPFGTSFEEVKSMLQKKYEYGFTTVQVLGDTLRINNFKLGNREFDVFLHFDPDKKFSTFSFNGKKKTANYLESEVFDDLNYLNEVFINKYGKPDSCNTPNVLKIGTHGQRICGWDTKDMFIATGILVYEFQYYANGMVSYKPLEEKKMSKDKEEKKKGAAEGAKAF